MKNIKKLLIAGIILTGMQQINCADATPAGTPAAAKGPFAAMLEAKIKAKMADPATKAKLEARIAAKMATKGTVAAAATTTADATTAA